MRLRQPYTCTRRNVAAEHRDGPRGGKPLCKISLSKDGPYLISGNLPPPSHHRYRCGRRVRALGMGHKFGTPGELRALPLGTHAATKFKDGL